MQLIRTPEQMEPTEEPLNLKFIDGLDEVTQGIYNRSQADNTGQVERYSLKNTLYTEDWVYITVDAIAQPLSRVPWLVYRKVRSGNKITYVKNESHPLNKLLEDPSKTIDATTFKYMLFAEDALMGNALIWYAKTLNEMHIIPSENADYVYDFKASGFPTAIRVNGSHVQSNSITLPTSAIIHVMRPQTSNKFWGLSPFIPASKSIKFQSYSADFLNAFYQRGATPQAILKLEKEANVENATRLLKKFEAAYSGRANSRRTMLLPKGVEFQTLDAKIADQQIIELINMNRENILNALHIPKHVVSLNSAGSLGSEEFKTSLKYFWQACLIPITERFAGKFTRFFADQLGPENVIGFDFSEIEILQEDELKKALLSKELLNVMTVNEVRAKVFQLEPIADGNVIPSLIPKPAQPQMQGPAVPEPSSTPSAPPAAVPVPELPAAVEESYEPEETLQVKNAGYFDKRSSLLKAHDAIIDSEENAKTKALHSQAEKMLDAQFDAIDKALLNTFKQKSFEFDEAAFQKEIDRLIKDMSKTYVDDYGSVLFATMELGYAQQLSAVFNKQNKEAIQALRVRGQNKRRAILNDRGLEYFQSTFNTSAAEAIRKTRLTLNNIASGLEANMTVPEIAKTIKTHLTSTKKNRAMTIARTEVATAVALGAQAMQVDTLEVIPNLKKIWRCAMDLRVRGNPSGYYKNSKSDHWNVHGESIKAGEKYSNGLRYPHDPDGSAGNVINCRCREIIIDPEDEQFLDLAPLPNVAEQTQRTRPIPKI